MSSELTGMQIDALGELANIASGTAATALSQMLSREVDLKVPNVLMLPFAEAVDAAGDAAQTVDGIVIRIEGALDGLVLLLIDADDAHILCEMLGVDRDSEVGESALREIGNILGTSYLNALAALTGLELMPCPPLGTTDLLGAIVETVLAESAENGEIALVLDSKLDISGFACGISFLLVPTANTVGGLLVALGLAAPAA